VFPNTNNVRNANAERQARFRATPQGRTAAAVRNERLKLKRRAAKRLYHQQRRAAIIDCAGPGQRVRDVGAEGVKGTAVHRRFLEVAIGWHSELPQHEGATLG
jgi:hypothetical protein